MALIALPRAGLQAIVAGILGIDAIWATDPKPFVNPTTQAQATLSVRGRKMIGYDEARSTFTPGSPGTLQVAKSGQREFTLSVLVESFNTEIGYADDYLDTLITRLWWDSSDAALYALNAAFLDCENVVTLPTNYDNRVISAASIDLYFGWAFDDLTDASPQGWIDTVMLTPPGAPGTNTLTVTTANGTITGAAT